MTTTHPTEATATVDASPVTIHVGWDGISQPIRELLYPCGCRTTLGGAVTRDCDTHFTAACRAQSARLAQVKVSAAYTAQVEDGVRGVTILVYAYDALDASALALARFNSDFAGRTDRAAQRVHVTLLGGEVIR